MTIKDYANGRALNTREGFALVFNYGMSLCEEFCIPANTLPVSLVLDDIDDAAFSNSTLPIKPILNLSIFHLPF